MAQLNMKVNDDVKRAAEIACKDIAMSMSTAINIFLGKLGKERRIPFEVTADPDPFYSQENQLRLKKAISDMKAGRNTAVHELIED